MFHYLFNILFPPKCTLCAKILTHEETDLCHTCRTDTLQYKVKFKIPFVAGWTAMWYYKDNARKSLLRFKFFNKRSYAQVYGRLLANHLSKTDFPATDVLTWIPISSLRRLKRGYDQVELIADAVGKELGITPVKLLKKIRHTPPQSGIKGAAQRRANVLGAYRVTDPALVEGKRILLLDDIVTTGASLSECAKTLQFASAKEVYCAAVAAASHDKTNNM